MSVEKLRREAHRWLRQAQDDLETASLLVSSGKFAQSAFLSQQAGEKATKALWFAIDANPWGHSVGRLLRELPDLELRERFGTLVNSALALDKLYISTRYPDSLAELTPSEAYTQPEAEAAVGHAAAIIAAIQEWLTQTEEPGR